MPFKHLRLNAAHEASVVTIELYRHGHSEKNANSRYVGGWQPDAPLTYLGEAQSCVLGWGSFKTRRSRSGNELFAAAYSSTAVRAVRTGEISFLAAGIEMPIIQLPGLNEMSKGVWEGELRDGPLEHNGQTLYYPSRHKTTWESKVPGGQSYAEVAALKTRELTTIGEAHQPGDRIAVFGHAIASRCVLANMHGQSLSWFEMRFPHCTYITFTYSQAEGLQLAALPLASQTVAQFSP